MCLVSRYSASPPGPSSRPGVRRGGDLDADTVAALRAALAEHKVIFFRDQHHLTEDGQYEFAELLGNFVQRIVGLPGNESHALFRLFQDRVTRLEHTTRWDWSLGDVAIWDNRATQHYAIDDYDGAEHRRLTRITLAGEVPVGVDGRRSTVIAGDAEHYSAPAARAA